MTNDKIAAPFWGVESCRPDILLSTQYANVIESFGLKGNLASKETANESIVQLQ